MRGDGLLSISVQTNQASNHLLTQSCCSADKFKEKKRGRGEFPFIGTYRSTGSCQAATRLAEETGLIVSDYPAGGKKHKNGWRVRQRILFKSFFLLLFFLGFAKVKQRQNATLLGLRPNSLNSLGCMHVHHIGAAWTRSVCVCVVVYSTSQPERGALQFPRCSG